MKKEYKVLNILLYFVFALYLFILLAILFRTKHQNRSLNLIPFYSIRAYIMGDDKIMRTFAPINVLGNIVIFIPLGIYFSLFSRLSKKTKSILGIFLFSTIVEAIQFMFKLGIGDIDDVILNFLGGAIGVGIYKILMMIFKDNNKVRNIIAICAPFCGILSFAILILINR